MTPEQIAALPPGPWTQQNNNRTIIDGDGRVFADLYGSAIIAAAVAQLMIETRAKLDEPEEA